MQDGFFFTTHLLGSCWDVVYVKCSKSILLSSTVAFPRLPLVLYLNLRPVLPQAFPSTREKAVRVRRALGDRNGQLMVTTAFLFSYSGPCIYPLLLEDMAPCLSVLSLYIVNTRAWIVARKMLYKVLLRGLERVLKSLKSPFCFQKIPVYQHSSSSKGSNTLF